MNKKIFISTILIVSLFVVISSVNAQEPSVGPTSGEGGQAPSVVCKSDNDCGEGLVCRNGDCGKLISPTTPSVPISTGGGQTPSVACTSDTDCGSGLTCYKGECYKPVSPGVVVDPTATGGGSGSVVPSNSNGKCPDRYIVSDDGESCLKIDAYSFPTVGPSVIGGGQTTMKPSDGKCPTEYILSKDGGECLKPSVPTVFVPPTAAALSIVFTSEKINVRDVVKKKEINVAPTEGFKVVVDAQIPVTVQKDTNNIITISRNNIVALVATGEAVQIKEGKITVSNKEVKIMPDTAVAIASSELKAEAQSVKLESGSAGATYQMEMTRDARIFGLFKVTVPIIASVDAQTSVVKVVKKPWWSFLAF